MDLLRIFRKKAAEIEISDRAQEAEGEDLAVYTGMRSEIMAGGKLLFVAKLLNIRGGMAELHQYTETDGVPELQAQDGEEPEPLAVSIRGYSDRERKAVYLEGAITPRNNRIWQVEHLALLKVANDRAFFRLDINMDATMIMATSRGADVQPCRLLNMSVGGACVATASPRSVGDRFLLNVQLLPERESSVLLCVVRRVVREEAGAFEYGCQFLDMRDADQEKVTQVLFDLQRKKNAH